jgi:hypothetical protein
MAIRLLRLSVLLSAALVLIYARDARAASRCDCIFPEFYVWDASNNLIFSEYPDLTAIDTDTAGQCVDWCDSHVWGRNWYNCAYTPGAQTAFGKARAYWMGVQWFTIEKSVDNCPCLIAPWGC